MIKRSDLTPEEYQELIKNAFEERYDDRGDLKSDSKLVSPKQLKVNLLTRPPSELDESEFETLYAFLSAAVHNIVYKAPELIARGYSGYSDIGRAHMYTGKNLDNIFHDKLRQMDQKSYHTFLATLLKMNNDNIDIYMNYAIQTGAISDNGSDIITEALYQMYDPNNQNADEDKVDIIKDLSSEELYMDIVKLANKYTIRLADSKYYVASSDVKVVMRDPSEKPAWAIWFLGAVPLADIPDRNFLCLLSEEEKTQHYPQELADNPIICHATLWKAGENKSAIILHTAWTHLSQGYKWTINKPIEIASLIFRAVPHPAHFAKFFGTPQSEATPGDKIFDYDLLKKTDYEEFAKEFY